MHASKFRIDSLLGFFAYNLFVPRLKVIKTIHVRYLAVGILNFIFANVLFVFFWYFNSESLTYWKIASIVTIISAIFSFFSQNVLTLRQEIYSLRSFFKYFLAQIIWLPLGIICVPRMAKFLNLPLVLVQLLFTAFIISVNWLILTAITRKTSR